MQNSRRTHSAPLLILAALASLSMLSSETLAQGAAASTSAKPSPKPKTAPKAVAPASAPAVDTPAEPPAAPPPPPPPPPATGPVGIGPLRLGMTPEEVTGLTNDLDVHLVAPLTQRSRPRKPRPSGRG